MRRPASVLVKACSSPYNSRHIQIFIKRSAEIQLREIGFKNSRVPHQSAGFRRLRPLQFGFLLRNFLRLTDDGHQGLYLNPPDNALVLCVDEKTQIQALERSQPELPMGLGYVDGVTHDYFRHGTTTLFAALDIATGTVIAQCKPRHRHQKFLSFLNHIERSVPAELDVHVVMDNYATHKHAKVRAWFAKRPRYHVHFTPTYASWLNQVERWFGLISQRAIKRGSFRNVKSLIERIEKYIASHNTSGAPFKWTATAASILEKLARLSKLIWGTSLGENLSFDRFAPANRYA